MKICFIIKKLTISTPLGIMYLSSALKKYGHKISLLCFEDKNFFDDFEQINPDIIAYSITTGLHKDCISINEVIKKSFNVLSVFGGPHPTFYPEMIKKDGVDAVCLGEGEEAFVEFVNKYEKGEDITKIKNFWVKKEDKIFDNPVRDVSDIEKINFPDRELVYEKDNFFSEFTLKRFIASRGCPFKCTYCFNRRYNRLYEDKGAIIRHRSSENIIKEINEVREKFPLGVVKFVDDTFNINKSWLKGFCEKYKNEVGLPFICNLRADFVNQEIVKVLKEANCIVAYLGIETGDEGLRINILERNMSNEKIKQACKLLKEENIKIITQNMLGLPGETIEQSFKTILLNAECKPDFPAYSIFTPYPKTVLADYAIKNGYFDGNFDRLNESYLSRTCLNYGSKEKLQMDNLHKFATMASRWPFLIPWVKLLIKLPRNFIYNFIFKFNYGLCQLNIYLCILGKKKQTLRLMKKALEFIS